MDFRASYGENITGDSWVMETDGRQQTLTHGANLGLATCPKNLKVVVLNGFGACFMGTKYSSSSSKWSEKT